MEYLESSIETLVYDILFAFEWLGINHKQAFYCNATFTQSVMVDKCNLQSPEFKIQKGNISFCYTLPKISHILQVIPHYIINLIYVHSSIRDVTSRGVLKSCRGG